MNLSSKVFRLIGLNELEIEDLIAKKRDELLLKMEESDKRTSKIKEYQVHQLAEAKERDNKRFGAALGIRSDYKAGAAFETKKVDKLIGQDCC